MRFKLDENIGRSGRTLLEMAGHDVATVRDESLGGATDEAVLKVTVAEGRTLITLDHDFGQVLRFPPETTHGIVILELPPRLTLGSLHERLREFLAVLKTRPMKNELWIVEPGRVRIHQRDHENG
ncbi:DUF5615 family PIN-like protein [Candidatus Nitrospira bockiana]